MPLKNGSDKATIDANIKLLISEGRPPKQAAAIAYQHAGKYSGKKKTHDNKKPSS